jgi:hypothetical protein
LLASFSLFLKRDDEHLASPQARVLLLRRTGHSLPIRDSDKGREQPWLDLTRDEIHTENSRSLSIGNFEGISSNMICRVDAASCAFAVGRIISSEVEAFRSNATMFRDAGLASVRVEPLAFSVRDPAAVDNVIGLS